MQAREHFSIKNMPMFAYVAIFLYLCRRKSKLRTIMRKLFSFFAMAAIVLGMASCGDGNDPNNPNTPFKLEVQNLTDESADIVVTPASDAEYLWTNVEQRYLTNHHFAKLEDYVANLLSTTTYAKMETAGRVLSGSKTIPLSGLNKNNAYYFIVFRVDEEFKLSGEVYSVRYTPGTNTDEPGTPDQPITFAVSPTTINAPATGGTFTLTVNTNSVWVASAEAAWATLSPTSGEGNATVTVTIEPATSTEETSQKITFSAGTNTYYVTVKRAGKSNTNPPDQTDPNTPTGLKVRIVYHSVGWDIIDYFQLTWNPVNGATAYKVYREDVWAHGEKYGQVYTPNRVIAEVTTPEFKDNSFDTEAWGYQSMKLKYTVTAITSKGESKPCEVVEEWWEPGV